MKINIPLRGLVSYWLVVDSAILALFDHSFNAMWTFTQESGVL